MTIYELINILSKFKPDAEICFKVPGNEKYPFYGISDKTFIYVDEDGQDFVYITSNEE